MDVCAPCAFLVVDPTELEIRNVVSYPGYV